MSRKRRKKREREERKARQGEAAPPSATAPAGEEKEAITPAGRKTIIGGVLLLIAGFIVLTLTDPQGRNWASTLSPMIILGAYGVIAYGIFQPEKEDLKLILPQETKEDTPETS